MTARRPAYTGGVAIMGTGMCLPPRVLTNEDLAQRVETRCPLRWTTPALNPAPWTWCWSPP